MPKGCFVEPSIVGQPRSNYATVETSVVTRRLRVVVIPALRARLVCIEQVREVEASLAPRLVAVDMEREVSLFCGARSVTVGRLSPRVVVIPPEETCCE
jgi:hypothetical protein